MARQRVLKPGFFTNEELAACAPLTRLFFQGLWCWADREGRLEDRPRRLKAEVLPYDEADADAMVSDLLERGFLERYEVDGVKVLGIINFAKHQSPHPKEIASVLPSNPSRGKDRPSRGKVRSSNGNAAASNVQGDTQQRTFQSGISGSSGSSHTRGEAGATPAAPPAPTVDDEPRRPLLLLDETEGKAPIREATEPSPFTRVVAAWFIAWERAGRGKHSALTDVEGATVKRLIKQLGADELVERIERAFADPWFLEHGDLLLFAKQREKFARPGCVARAIPSPVDLPTPRPEFLRAHPEAVEEWAGYVEAVKAKAHPDPAGQLTSLLAMLEAKYAEATNG